MLAILLRRQTNLLRVLEDIVLSTHRASTHLIVTYLLLLLMLGTHHLQALAVHFRLAVVEVTEDSLALGMRFEKRAEKSLAFILKKFKILKLFNLILVFNYYHFF